MKRDINRQSCGWLLWLRPLLLRCFCKADLGPVALVADALSAQLCPNSVSHHCEAFYLKWNGWFSGFFPPQDIRFLKTLTKGLFCVPACDDEDTPSFPAFSMSLLVTLCSRRSVRVKEAFTDQICRSLSGLMCQIFTSWLEVGWVPHCLNGPALHCHSPSHHTGPQNCDHY